MIKNNVGDFYKELLGSREFNEDFKNKLNDIRDENEYRKFIRDEILPIAKEKGYNFNEDDVISYDRSVLQSLSEEELENVTGGKVSLKNMSAVVMSALSIMTAVGLQQASAVNPHASGTAQTVSEEQLRVTRKKEISNISDIYENLDKRIKSHDTWREDKALDKRMSDIHAKFESLVEKEAKVLKREKKHKELLEQKSMLDFAEEVKLVDFHRDLCEFVGFDLNDFKIIDMVNGESRVFYENYLSNEKVKETSTSETESEEAQDNYLKYLKAWRAARLDKSEESLQRISVCKKAWQLTHADRVEDPAVRRKIGELKSKLNVIQRKRDENQESRKNAIKASGRLHDEVQTMFRMSPDFKQLNDATQPIDEAVRDRIMMALEGEIEKRTDTVDKKLAELKTNNEALKETNEERVKALEAGSMDQLMKIYNEVILVNEKIASFDKEIKAYEAIRADEIPIILSNDYNSDYGSISDQLYFAKKKDWTPVSTIEDGSGYALLAIAARNLG